VLIRYALWISRTVAIRSAVGAQPRPNEEQILNLTTRLWEGPPKSFFAAEPFQSQKCVSQHDQQGGQTTGHSPRHRDRSHTLLHRAGKLFFRPLAIASQFAGETILIPRSITRE
jgi:hypothetical protein